MKALKLLTFSLAVIAGSAQAGFINPMNFDGSESQRNEVIEYIQERVRINYCEKIDMCQASMLRMMEKENLEAFKRMTKANNAAVMKRVIDDYCHRIDMCDYSTLEMMYQENNKASEQTLEW